MSSSSHRSLAVPCRDITEIKSLYQVKCIDLVIGELAPGLHLLTLHRYNVGVLASVLAHPGFRETIPGYGPYRRGLITAIYYLGTWLSYVFFSRPATDLLGRRYAAMVGMSVLCVGQALQAAASGSVALSMVISGRVVSGLGTGIVSTSVPLYQRSVTGIVLFEIHHKRDDLHVP